MALNKVLGICLLGTGLLWAGRSMEYLDRGLVAVKTSSGVFLSWRVLGTDASSTGFNIYRDGVKVNASVITGASNLVDAGGSLASSYTVKPVVGGVEQGVGSKASVWAAQYKTLPVMKPAGGTTPDKIAYTYMPNDIATGDLDGDGQWELVLKWDPSNSKDNSQSGYTGNVYIDAYELDGTRLWRIDLGKNIRAGAHYTQMLVGDYDLDGKAEVALKTAPGTKDGSGSYLSTGPAASDDDGADYRNSSGYVLSGPEYLTIFAGSTGRELSSIAYVPGRGTVSSWGDSYGNRVDRFLATNAYLDGVKPSMVFQRGYYTRAAVVAFDWNGTSLSQRWYHNSATKGSGCYGQGNHNLSALDVDSDGKDEILEGSCALDHDGSLLYRTGLGHGDAMHVGDLMPGRAGLEVFTVHEETASAYGYEMHDARTGTVIWGKKTGTDNGRGLSADIDSSMPGSESWSYGNGKIVNSQGDSTAFSRPSINFRIYWDGDLQDELLDGTKLDDWNGKGASRLMSFYNYPTAANGAVANNTTKANPGLVADLLGDWREEAIYSLASGDSLVVFTTVIQTPHRLYTLMHDPAYRNAISWQNTAYNQPPHLGFFLGAGVDKAPVPSISLVNAPATVVNTAPAILSPASVTVEESATNKFVLKILASDAEGDALTYTISGGDDQSLFLLGSSSANLYFNKVPDFEAPRDLDGNNVYKLRLEVSDGKTSTSQNLFVTVGDVYEAPASSSSLSPSSSSSSSVAAPSSSSSLTVSSSSVVPSNSSSAWTSSSSSVAAPSSSSSLSTSSSSEILSSSSSLTVSSSSVAPSSSSSAMESSSASTTAVLPGSSQRGKTAYYEVYDLAGRPYLRSSQMPLGLPEGRWVIRAYDAKGQELYNRIWTGKGTDGLGF